MHPYREMPLLRVLASSPVYQCTWAILVENFCVAALLASCVKKRETRGDKKQEKNKEKIAENTYHKRFAFLLQEVLMYIILKTNRKKIRTVIFSASRGLRRVALAGVTRYSKSYGSGQVGLGSR